VKVYVTSDGEYSDYHVTGVFSTREKADAYLAACRQVRNGATTNDVDEYDLDQLAGRVFKPFAGEASLIHATGEVTTATFDDGYKPEYRSRGDVTEPGERCRVVRLYDRTVVYSYESQEHAHNVAVEEYQRRLREAATHPAEAKS
jgi:hypothetical protein